MIITTAEFITSSDCLKNCPDFGLPEIAMIGRSNVGKSSFINTLCNRKNLAKTSNTPGKTRLINFYKFNNALIIADLPGYGYAKVSKTEQKKWAKNLEEYLIKRNTLKSVIQLLDARHEIQNNDLEMREWLEYYKIRIITVATKIDYVPKPQVKKVISGFSAILNSEVIPFSSKTGVGKNEILNILSTFL